MDTFPFTVYYSNQHLTNAVVKPVVYQVVGYYVTVQVVGFFDVAARLSAGYGPIAALVGGSSCSIDSALRHRTLTTKISQTSKNKHQRRKIRLHCPISRPNLYESRKNVISIIAI